MLFSYYWLENKQEAENAATTSGGNPTIKQEPGQTSQGNAELASRLAPPPPMEGESKDSKPVVEELGGGVSRQLFAQASDGGSAEVDSKPPILTRQSSHVLQCTTQTKQQQVCVPWLLSIWLLGLELTPSY